MNVKLLTLFLILCTSFQATANMHSFNLSVDSFNQDFEDISTVLEEIFQENPSDIGITPIRNYLRGLVRGTPYDDYLEAPSMCIEKSFEDGLFINAEGEFDAFHFSYFKLKNGFNESIESPIGDFGVTMADGWQLSILTLYGTDDDRRSSLYIIIIDKDLARCGSDCNSQRQYAPRHRNHIDNKTNSSDETAKLETHSFPNPTYDRTLFTFQLDKDQKVSLQLINPSSGSVITRRLENLYLQAGIHQYDFDMNPLPAGMYLIALKTEDHLQSIPIIKTE